MGIHIVRYGLLGNVGRFTSTEAIRYPRHTRVIVRSRRGLEIGEILSIPQRLESESATSEATSGQILRKVTVEDDLLQTRLDSRRNKAFQSCQQLLNERNITAALIDVEHLFDGEGLYFYFLGEPPTEAINLTQELAARYEAAVEFRNFADTLSEGCGPGCGTEEAMGQGGCDSCVSCTVASACGTKPRA